MTTATLTATARRRRTSAATPAATGAATHPWARLAADLESAIAAADSADREVSVLALGTGSELTEQVMPSLGSRSVLLAGSQLLVLPDDGPGSCPQCVARRWQSARPALLREATELAADTVSDAGPPVLLAAVVSAVVALLDLVPTGQVSCLDIASLTVAGHPVAADPCCPRCGAGHTVGLAPLADRFGPSRKGPDGYRTRRLADYPLSVPALTNPVGGVVGRGYVCELGLPSTAAIWGSFATRTPGDTYEIFWAGHANSYDASIRIGLLEGLERYAGMVPPERTLRSSRTELARRGVQHVDPRDCGLYDETCYARTPWLVPYSDDLVLPWVPAHSLASGETVWVPEVTAYYRTGDDGSRFVQECSNGCASGASLTEAAYCGLMELIERDAFLLTWYGGVPLPEIDGRTSTRASTRTMIDRLELYGYRARFFDARIGFGVPVVIGVAERIGGGLGAMCVGGGCGLDPEDAIAGALVEISTDSLNLRGRVERDHARLAAIADDFELLQSIHDHPIVFGLPRMAAHADFLLRGSGSPLPLAEVYPTRPTRNTGDLADDLAWCVERLAAAGFETLVVDQTTAEQREAGVHTASVIVPGLLPIDFGWGRQRCLDMPRMRTALREAGLIDRDLTRDDLNLVPHPFP